MIRVTSPLRISVFLCAALARPASAQFFKLVSTTTKLTQISAGGTSVWGVDASGVSYLLNPSTFSFGTISSGVKQVAVGGGTLVVSDDVWILQQDDTMFRARVRNPTMSGDFTQVTGSLSQIAVGPGLYGLPSLRGLGPQLLRYDLQVQLLHRTVRGRAATSCQVSNPPSISLSS